MRRRLFTAAVIATSIGMAIAEEFRFLGRMGRSMWRSRFPRKADK